MLLYMSSLLLDYIFFFEIILFLWFQITLMDFKSSTKRIVVEWFISNFKIIMIIANLIDIAIYRSDTYNVVGILG